VPIEHARALGEYLIGKADRLGRRRSDERGSSAGLVALVPPPLLNLADRSRIVILRRSRLEYLERNASPIGRDHAPVPSSKPDGPKRERHLV